MLRTSYKHVQHVQHNQNNKTKTTSTQESDENFAFDGYNTKFYLKIILFYNIQKSCPSRIKCIDFNCFPNLILHLFPYYTVTRCLMCFISEIFLYYIFCVLNDGTYLSISNSEKKKSNKMVRDWIIDSVIFDSILYNNVILLSGVVNVVQYIGCNRF